MFLFIGTGSQYVVQAGLVLFSSCISIMNTGIIGVHTVNASFSMVLEILHRI